jgi:hypothetical protein
MCWSTDFFRMEANISLYVYRLKYKAYSTQFGNKHNFVSDDGEDIYCYLLSPYTNISEAPLAAIFKYKLYNLVNKANLVHNVS